MPSLFLPFKPFPCRKVEKALLKLGFQECSKNGTSHRQFKAIKNGKPRKVTLDCHKGEVSAKNVKSIIAQTGVSRKEFIEALEG